MARKKNEILKHVEQAKMPHEQIRWSNAIVNAPVVYSLLERRMLYFLTGEVKHKYVEKNLGVPASWQDLYFHLTDKDLGLIGGKTNVLNTYEALSELGKKFVPVSFRNEKGELIFGRVHWVDTFFYNTETKLYDVRVSPEIMPYLIDISKSFTTFDLGTAMLLRSKYTQKFYELCSQFCGDFRYSDPAEEALGNMYKKRVIPFQMDVFRRIFNLEEVRDARTKRIITPASYQNYKDIQQKILEVAQKELYDLYSNGFSNLWFDYQEGAKKGRGGKVLSIVVYIYTKDNPKQGNALPWQKGDLPLDPFEEHRVDEKPKPMTAMQRLHANMWYGCPQDQQEYAVQALLARYLDEDEVIYYMRQIRLEARECSDSYVQVMQVIQEKEQQPKFKSGTKVYKHNNIVKFALQENLKEFGWSLSPMQKRRKSKKEVVEPDLFRQI